MKLANDAVRLAVGHVFIGGFSFLIVSVGARTLSASSMAEFSVLWAAVNTIALSVLIPIEIYGPKLRAELLRIEQNIGSLKSLISKMGIEAGALTISLLLIAHVLHVFTATFIGVIGYITYVIGLCIYGVRKAQAIAIGDFRTNMKLSVVLFLTGLMGLLVYLQIDPSDGGWLFVVAGIANLSALLFMRINRYQIEESHQKNEVLKRVKLRFHIRHLWVGSFLSLVLSNGAVSVGLRVGVAPHLLVAYSASLNFVLVATTILNTVSMPILREAVDLISSSQRQKLLQLMKKALTGFLIAILSLCFIFPLIGNKLLNLYIGDQYSLSTMQILVIAVSEGLATMTVLPRIFLLALGKTESITKIWSYGAAIFLLVLFLPLEPLFRISIAPGTAGIAIIAVSSFKIRNEIKKF